MSASQRRKGHNYEREIARRLQSLFPDAKRNVTETQTGGQGVDIVGTGALAIQCKRLKRYAAITKINEINAPGKIPVLITKGDRLPDMAVLPLDALLAILEDIGIVYEEE